MPSRISTALIGAGGIALALALASCTTGHEPMAGTANDRQGQNWAIYGGENGNRFSPLNEIDRRNVARLVEAWRFETGPGSLQTSPLVVDGVFYAMTAAQEVIALDAATGALIWKQPMRDAGQQPIRSMTWWQDGPERRLLVGIGPFLNAIDPATGQPIASFGNDGRIDMREGLGRPIDQMPLAMTSPGVVWRDMIIVGFRTTESKPAAPGAVRAYDVRTGALRWKSDLLPRPGQPGSETWPKEALDTAGGANNWAGMAVDWQRGIVFVPVGSAVDDFYGGDRLGQNLYANSLVALDATTGRHLWHRQLVHHDILDRDIPSPPVLLRVRRNGKSVDAVAQATKHGALFIFDRVTGKPLFDIVEKPVPASDVPGEQAWPTQPEPVAPAPFARQHMTANMVTNRTPEAHAAVAAAFAGMRNEGPFTPVGLDRPTLIFPGFDGGAEWGGQAADNKTGIIYINANDVPWMGQLARIVPTGTGALAHGEELYQQNCAACHGMDRAGAPPEFPSLVGTVDKLGKAVVAGVIAQGRGRMPGFTQFNQSDVEQILAYLRQPASGDKREMQADTANASGPPRYSFTGYKKFVDPDGYPAVVPPWGTLSAIDMNSGKYVWRIPLGEYPELAAKGLRNTGTENYGGPLLTGRGLLFIGATIFDRQFRAFDAANGRLLWQATLPYSGVASPITYRAGGRQFVAIATSASRNPRSAPGSAYVVFALPEAKQ